MVVARPPEATPPDPELLGKGERTRRRLLEHAVARFAQEGYRRTSLSDIARDAGVTPAAAYAYFDGKEALFEAAVDADAAALIDAARRDAGSGPVQERWPRLVNALAARIEAGEHPLALRVLAGGEPEVVHRLLTLPTLAALRSEIAAELRAGMADGSVRADIDPEVMSLGLESIVLALLMGGIQARVDDPERAAATLAVIDAAIRPPRARG